MTCLVILGREESRSGGLKAADRAAVSLALELSETGFEACSHLEEGLRYALAAGASRAVSRLDRPVPEFDIALVGSGGDALAARLAEAKGCGLVLDILSVKPAAGHGLEVVRSLGEGAREVLLVSRPAVLRVSEDASNTLYVSRFRRQNVELTRADLLESNHERLPGVSAGPWELASPRARIGDLSAKTQGSAASRADLIYGTAEETSGPARETVIVADPPTAARHLLRFLRHQGFIQSPSSPEPDGIVPGVSARPTEERVEGTPQTRKTRGPVPSRRAPRPTSTGRESGPQRGPSRAPRPAPPGDRTDADSPSSERAPRGVGNPGRTRRKPRPVNTEDKT